MKMDFSQTSPTNLYSLVLLVQVLVIIRSWGEIDQVRLLSNPLTVTPCSDICLLLLLLLVFFFQKNAPCLQRWSSSSRVHFTFELKQSRTLEMYEIPLPFFFFNPYCKFLAKKFGSWKSSAWSIAFAFTLFILFMSPYFYHIWASHSLVIKCND